MSNPTRVTTSSLIVSASERSGIPVKLIKAVVRQIGGGNEGLESLQDVLRHGIGSGFPGFANYSDTVQFFRKNRSDIVELVKEQASSLDENPVEMVCMFRCLGGSMIQQSMELYRRERLRRMAMDDYGEAVAKCLYGRMDDNCTTVANALAWFAAEEVARALFDH